MKQEQFLMNAGTSKKTFANPQVRLINLATTSIISTSNVSPLNLDEPEDLEYGGKF